MCAIKLSNINLPIIRGCEKKIAVQRMNIDALNEFVMKAKTLLCYGVAEVDLKTLYVSWIESHETAQPTKKTDPNKSIGK